MPAASSFPVPAVEWICGNPSSDVAIIGPTRDLVRGVIAAGHRVCALDRSLVALNRVRDDGLPLTAIAATAEQLPFAPYCFDTVICMQNLHQLAPGLALPEFARVLRPGGRLVAIYTTRDDTVPWVRRLAAVLHDVDPTAMQGDYGIEAIDYLEQSPYFPRVESRSFRTWVPVERPQLVAMVERRKAVAELDAERRAELTAAVGAIYDSTARAPEPLLLPYQATCWTATVDQSELSVPLPRDDGLRIW